MSVGLGHAGAEALGSSGSSPPAAEGRNVTQAFLPVLLRDYPGLSVFNQEAAWQYAETHREEIEQTIRLNQEA